jgi:flagellar biosynthesis protein FlhB
MSEDADDSDKQYEPTQTKLDDARKKGEIARSTDLTTAAGYAGFLLAAVAVGPLALVSLGTSLSVLLDQSDTLSSSIFAGSPTPLFGGVLAQVGASVSPWFAAPAALAVLSVLAQRGFVIASSKLEPKFSRISPIMAIGNKFGRNGLFEFFKSFVKLVIYSIILGFYLSLQLPRIVGTMQLSPAIVSSELTRLALGMMFIVLVVALVLGAIDYVWQVAEHTRKNRMSRKEMMDEVKNSEGDPMMKQQRRQKGISIAMNQMLAEVPKADVVIVNPTHYAVALQWDRTAGSAPICIAKGVDEIAARIREIANANAVPIHADPPTARALHAKVDIGQEVAPDDYRAVAAAIRFAESMRQKARGR